MEDVKKSRLKWIGSILVLIVIFSVFFYMVYYTANDIKNDVKEAEILCKGLCDRMNLNYSGTNGWGDTCFCKTHEFMDAYTVERFDLYVKE